MGKLLNLPLIHANQIGSNGLPNDPFLINKHVVYVSVIPSYKAIDKVVTPFLCVISNEYPDDFAIKIQYLRALTGIYQPRSGSPPSLSNPNSPNKHPIYGDFYRFNDSSLLIYNNIQGNHNRDTTTIPTTIRLAKGIDAFIGTNVMVKPSGLLHDPMPNIPLIGVNLLLRAKFRVDINYTHIDGHMNASY